MVKGLTKNIFAQPMDTDNNNMGIGLGRGGGVR